MQKEYDLNLLTPQLAKFGLRKFLRHVDYQDELMERTVGQRKLGSRLGFTFDIINTYMEPPANGDKNFRMYEHILGVLNDSDCGRFLLALEKSGNEHIINYIKRMLDGNDDNCGAIMTTRQENPSSSSSSTSCSTETKVQVVSRHLKSVDLAQFLRQNSLYLCQHTKNLNVFILSLTQLGVISQIEADAMKQLIDFDACAALYRKAGQTGYGGKLISALQSSQNVHVIEEMYKWISP